MRRALTQTRKRRAFPTFDLQGSLYVHVSQPPHHALPYEYLYIIPFGPNLLTAHRQSVSHGLFNICISSEYRFVSASRLKSNVDVSYIYMYNQRERLTIIFYCCHILLPVCSSLDICINILYVGFPDEYYSLYSSSRVVYCLLGPTRCHVYMYIEENRT